MKFSWKVNTSEEAIKDRSESTFINTSGIYEVKLKHILYNKSQNGSESLHLVVEYDGQEQTFYNAIRLTNNDGSPNFESNLFNKLCVICGAKDGEEVSPPVPVTLKIGNKEAEEYQELQDFRGYQFLVRIQFIYQMYNEEIQEKRAFRNFFTSDTHATAQEIVNNTEQGKQYAIEVENAEKIIYKDGITPEMVAEWKKKRASSKSENQPTNEPVFKRHTFGRTA